MGGKVIYFGEGYNLGRLKFWEVYTFGKVIFLGWLLSGSLTFRKVKFMGRLFFWERLHFGNVKFVALRYKYHTMRHWRK